MDLVKIFYWSILVSMTLYQVHCELITFGIGAAIVGAMLSLLNSKTPDHRHRGVVERTVLSLGRKLGFAEGCEDHWIPANLNGLEFDLQENVFGQPFAVDMVLHSLRHHLKYQPKRALMLSFHGPPGTGKNFISQSIVNNMFRKRQHSDFAHIFRASTDFPLKEKVNEYKEQIASKIMHYVMDCHRSIFIFDEVEKMPDGLLDVLSGFVKSQEYNGVNFRGIIFILLTNVGSTPILDLTLDWYNEGHIREDIDDLKLTKVIREAAFRDKGGLKNTGLVENYGISHFVPFLPLEKKHILQCLEREVNQQGQKISNELANQVFDELHFIPEPDGPFAYSGCKGVAEAAQRLIQREMRRQRRKKKLQ